MSRLLTVLLMMAGFVPGFALAEEAAIAAIDVSAREDGVTIVGRVVALADGDYRGEMRIDRSGPSGKTRTSQGGELTLTALQEGQVASVGLSMEAGDTLAVEFVVTVDGRRVAVSSLAVGD